MPWNDREGLVPHRTQEELLALVHEKARASADRRRRRVGVATATAVLLVLGLAAAVTRRGPAPTTELRTTADGAMAPVPPPLPSTSVDPSRTTSTVASTVPQTTRRPSPVTTVRPLAPVTSPTTHAPSTTTPSTTTLVCRNSMDVACGPLRWEPPPGPNQPLTVTVTYTPTNPKAGETVTFRVVVDDPDGDVLLGGSGSGNDYGDGTPVGGFGGHKDCVAMFGVWTTNAPIPVHEELTFQHTYASPGTYVATFPFGTLGDCARGPSRGSGTATVTVTR